MTCRIDSSSPVLLRHRSRLAWVLALGLLALQPAGAQGVPNECGDLSNAYGPFDYRTVRGQQLQLVEGAHFTPAVEALIRGNASGNYPGGDLDYTLRAFPNHHRALASTARLAERDKTPKPRDMRYSVDCWFERAVRFRNDDLTVRMMFASHLAKTGRKPMALDQLAYVQKNVGDNPFTIYNLGLMYLEVGEFDRALEQAHQAYALGFPRPELRDRLKALNKWAEPVAGAASAPESAASSAVKP